MNLLKDSQILYTISNRNFLLEWVRRTQHADLQKPPLLGTLGLRLPLKAVSQRMLGFGGGGDILYYGAEMGS